MTTTPRVAIIGAGVSGLCMAIRLREAGIETFTVFEKSSSVGGTWRDNTYPGLYCDVPSRYFQYSFAPNPDWTRAFSPGPEIGAYLERVADRYGLRERIRFGVELRDARWEDGRWILTGDGVREEADFVVTGCGFLHRPSVPDIPGLDTFAGASFHSSRWDHDVPLTGRVGIVGTGSTGVQIVAELGGTPARLVQFTRTPQWVFPAVNPHYTRLSAAVYRRFPKLMDLAYRGHQWWFETFLMTALLRDGIPRRLVGAGCRLALRSVRDPDLRARLTPPDEPGCKRLVASAGYYRAVQRPDVDVVTTAIDHVEPRGVVTTDGVLHELDVLVLATGFDTHALVRPMEFTGPSGATLSDAWAGGPRGYGTVAVPGLPNLFMLMGPSSPVNISSMFNVAEAQAGYALAMITRWATAGRTALAPRADAAERFTAGLQDALQGSIWLSGCQSWYLTEDGTPVIWPASPAAHRELLGEPRLTDYERV
jgi:cation diffusion facilitator CzcD-associated flavoprotein CzcO